MNSLAEPVFPGNGGKLKVAVTGASGFLGGELVKFLKRKGLETLALTSSKTIEGLRHDANCEIFNLASLGEEQNYKKLLKALSGVDCLVHTAGLSSEPNIRSSRLNDDIFRINSRGTKTLGEICSKAGVKRFIFISTSKVYGCQSHSNHKFDEFDIPAPDDLYSCSKYLAEQELANLSKKSGMEVVVIRPPLILGNKLKDMSRGLRLLIMSGLPVPVIKCNNKRSVISIRNIINFIHICLTHPNATRHPLLITEDYTLSTKEIIKLVGQQICRRVRFFHISPSVASKIGHRSLLTQKFLSRFLPHQIDDTRTRKLLGWSPSPDEYTLTSRR